MAPLSIDGFAEARAALDAGQERAAVLRARGLDEDGWREEEERVLTDLADAADRADDRTLEAYRSAYRTTWRALTGDEAELPSDVAPSSGTPALRPVAPMAEQPPGPPVARASYQIAEAAPPSPVDAAAMADLARAAVTDETGAVDMSKIRAALPFLLAQADAAPPAHQAPAPKPRIDTGTVMSIDAPLASATPIQTARHLNQKATPVAQTQAAPADPPAAAQALHDVERMIGTDATGAVDLSKIRAALPFLLAKTDAEAAHASPRSEPLAPRVDTGTRMTVDPPSAKASPFPHGQPSTHSLHHAAGTTTPRTEPIDPEEVRKALAAHGRASSPALPAGPPLPMALERYVEISATLMREGSPEATFRRLGVDMMNWMGIVRAFSVQFASDPALQKQFDDLMQKAMGQPRA